MRRLVVLVLFASLGAGCTRTVYVDRPSPSPSPVVVSASPLIEVPLFSNQPPHGVWWCFLNTGTQSLSCGNSRLLLGDIPLGEGGVLYAMGPCSFQDVEGFEVDLPGEDFVTIWDCSGTLEGIG